MKPESSSGSILGRSAGDVIQHDVTPEIFRKSLVLLVLLGLVIRIGFFIEHSQTPSFGIPTLDQKYYDMVARMLIAGDDLHQLHGFRPLLYPIFLGVFYAVGGNWGADLAIFAQHLLGVATGVLIVVLGARLFRNRLAGLAGGVLFLLAPVPLYFEGELLIEPSYTFLICVALLLHLHAAESTKRRDAVLWFSCGALVVLTAQARANILVFLAVYPAFALWRWWQMRKAGSGLSCSPRKRLSSDNGEKNEDKKDRSEPQTPAGTVLPVTSPMRCAAVPLLGLLGALAMAIPWGFVNLKQSDHFHLLPNAGGVALYLGNKRSADGMVPEQERRILAGERYEDSIEVWAREEYESAMRTQGRQPDSDPMAVSRFWTRRTVDEVRADPVSWLRLMAKKTWLTFWNAEIPNNKAFAFLQQEFVWLRVLPVRWVALLMLAPAGIWFAARQGNRNALFIIFLYALLYSAANIVFFICDRYRYPVWPVMAALAGGGLLALLESLRTCRVRSLAWISASACVMATLSLPNWFGAKLPSFSRDYMFRSIAYYEKGRFEEALKDADRSVALDAREATALHHRGNVLFALNRLEAAREAYVAALRLSPGEAAIWNNLGAAFQNLGRTQSALDAFRRATACEPPSLNAFLGIALIQIRSGKLDEAANALTEFERRRSPDAVTLALRAVIARELGNTEKADSLALQARSLDSKAVAWALEQVALPGAKGGVPESGK